MTTTEFSNEFDILYNNAMSNQAPGLDEYEKSVFLTKAQDQLITDYFNNRVDGVGGGFDGSQKRQYDFSGIIRVENLYNINTFKERIDITEKLDRRSQVYLFPPNYFLAVNELLSDSKYQYSIIPLQYNDYQRLMMKPYAFPVKKAAWRLFTDKKNCNYYEETEPRTQDDSTVVEETMYSFLSTWADKKRNMKLTIHTAGNGLGAVILGEGIEIPSGTVTEPYYSVGKAKLEDENKWHDAVFFEYPEGDVYGSSVIIADTKWVNNVYTIELGVYLSVGNHEYDDADTVDVIKRCFKYLKEHPELFTDSDNDLLKASTHADGFTNLVAPSKYTEFQVGKTIETHIIQLPMAEIIGRFVDNPPTYQLRYVKTLKPIILVDLDQDYNELSIKNVQKKTECELPEECHQEILERAVTLAKIAYSGSTDTIARANQRQKRNND